MDYTNPREVRSPKVNITNLEPIVDKGIWDYSVALLDWDKKPRLAMRWNGGKGEDGKIHPGNPQSRGLPTWFLIPENYDLAFLKAINEKGDLGGEEIDVNKAKETVNRFLSKKLPSEIEIVRDDSGLEKIIVNILMKLKEEGKI